MADYEIVVKQKRGCTCCGTGCVLMTALVPLSVFAAWELLGAMAAFALWPTVILGAHCVRFATGRQKRYPRAGNSV